MADATVEIDSKIDTNGLEKGFERIKSDMGSISEQARKVGNNIKASFSDIDFSRSVEMTKVQIESLERQFEAVSEKLKFAIEDEDDKKAAQLGAKQEALYERLRTARAKLAVLVEDAANKQAAAEERAAAKAEAAAAKETAAQQKAAAAAERAAQKQEEAERRQQSAFGKTLNVIKNILGKIGGLTKAVGSFGAKLAGSVLGGIKKLIGLFTGASKGASRFKSRISEIASGAFVFNLISKGLSQVMQYMGKALNANNTFSAALAKLKGALLTAFQPIYELVVPALTTMINLLTRVAQAVGGFFAAITGKSYSAMSQNAESLYNTAQGFEAVGGAAEDAQKIFSGLDEVNVYSEKDSGGGGQTAAPDFSISEQLAGLTDGTLSELATSLTTKLNEMIANVDWVGMGGKLAQGIDSVLGFLANAILGFDWYAAASNLALMLNGVIKNVDWRNLGVILGAKFILLIEGLGGLFGTIDWTGLGNALASAFMGLWDSIDWEQAATTLSDGLIGAIDSLTTTISKIDWQKIGKDVAKFVAKIDWSGLFTALSEGIGAALGGIAEFIWGLIEDAVESVRDWWREHAVEDGKFSIEGLFEGIGEALSNLGSWIKENIFQPFIEGFKKVFGIHSPSTVMAEQGNYIIDGLLQGITGAWESITTFFSDALSSVASSFTECWENIKSGATEYWEDIKLALGEVWENIKSGITETFEEIPETIVSIFAKIEAKIKYAINNYIILPINMLLKKIIDGINTVFDSINSIGSAIGLSKYINIGRVSMVSIPYLAQGAVIPPNAPFMAVLGDQKNGKNIEAPADLISQIVGAELDKRAANGGGVFHFVAQLNGQTLFDQMIEEAELRQAATGQDPFALGY